MSLIRVFTKVDPNHKIALPRGIRKALDIKPGDKLELTVVGMDKSRTFLRVRKFTQKGNYVLGGPTWQLRKKMRDQIRTYNLCRLSPP